MRPTEHAHLVSSSFILIILDNKFYNIHITLHSLYQMSQLVWLPAKAVPYSIVRVTPDPLATAKQALTK